MTQQQISERIIHLAEKCLGENRLSTTINHFPDENTQIKIRMELAPSKYSAVYMLGFIAEFEELIHKEPLFIQRADLVGYTLKFTHLAANRGTEDSHLYEFTPEIDT